MRKEDISTPKHRLARRWLRTVNKAVQSAAWEAGALRTRTGPPPPRPKETGPWELGRREAWARGGVPHPAGQGQWPELHQSRLLHSAHKLPKWMTPSPPPPFEMAQSHEQHEVPADRPATHLLHSLPAWPLEGGAGRLCPILVPAQQPHQGCLLQLTQTPKELCRAGGKGGKPGRIHSPQVSPKCHLRTGRLLISACLLTEAPANNHAVPEQGRARIPWQGLSQP